MYESPRHLEGIAKQVHDKTGIRRPVDAFRLAHLCGLEVRFWSKRYGRLDEKTVFCPGAVRIQRQHRIVAHEVAHWLLRFAHCDDRDEDAADYLALALMLLRGPFERDLAETEWNLFALLDRHPNVSAQAMCVRMTHLSPCATSVYDQGSRTALYLGEGAYEDASDAELADAALAREAMVRDGLAVAYPFIEGRYRRIVVVRRAA
jgi:hypothetical protein